MTETTEQLQQILLGFKFGLYQQGLCFDNEACLDLMIAAMSHPECPEGHRSWMSKLIESDLLLPDAVLPSQTIVNQLREEKKNGALLTDFPPELVEQIAEVVETGIL